MPHDNREQDDAMHPFFPSFCYIYPFGIVICRRGRCAAVIEDEECFIVASSKSMIPLWLALGLKS